MLSLHTGPIKRVTDASNLIEYITHPNNAHIFELKDKKNRNQNADIEICGTMGPGTISPIKIQIITDGYENPDQSNSKNSNSMVMKLIHNRVSMLFFGDLENDETSGSKLNVFDKLAEEDPAKLKANVVMIPHHGSDNNGNGEWAFYETIGASHGIISSHIEDINEHPKVKTIQSFCQIPNINTCDIPCAYHYYGDKYINQATPVSLEGTRGQHLGYAAICPYGELTAYAPYKLVSVDLESTVELFKSKNTPHQIYGCDERKFYDRMVYGPSFIFRKTHQTTTLVEDKDGLNMQAYIICTYLRSNSDNTFNSVEIKKKRLMLEELNNKETVSKGATIFDKC